ncbi:MAG: hypothetical protein WBA68_04615 [Alteraurantiacibacter sp.]
MIAFGYSRLNIKLGSGWLCPSCGYEGSFQTPAFDAVGPLIGSGICVCCGYEPGFDDVQAASGVDQSAPVDALRVYSEEWRTGGMLWRGSIRRMPANWDKQAQLDRWERFCRPVLEA